MRPRRFELTTVAVATALSLSLCGCRAFDAALLEMDAGDASVQCPGRRPPAAPTNADGPGIGPVTLVLGKPVLDQRDNRWRNIGYNLDGLCSDGSEETVRCRAPALTAPPSADGEEGIDNAFGDSVLPLIFIARPEFEERARTGYGRGLGAILLQIDEWNGEPDDPVVHVAIIQTIFGSGEALGDFTTVEIGTDALLVDGSPHPYPEWDGGDFFWGRPDSFVLGDVSSPRLVVEDAYVVGGTLSVAIPGRVPLILGGDQSDVLITLTDAVLTIELGADRMTTNRAILAGRWSTADVLSALPPAGVCEGTEDYLSFQRLLDLAADIGALPSSTSPTCDAISVGLEFEPGASATLVDALMPFPSPSPCASSSTDAGAGDAGGDGG